MKLGVVFGGMSTEHDVSIVSGISIIKNLKKEKYEIFPIYINEKGEWFFYKTAIEEIPEVRVGDKLNDSQLEPILSIEDFLRKMDCIFPVLHGLYGEDGTIQGLLELLKIPYVGCKVLSSAISMDKAYTKVIFDKIGLNQAKYVYLKKTKEDYDLINRNFDRQHLSIQEVIRKVEGTIDSYPMFVKPSNSGSSVGIKKVSNGEQLKEAIEFASKFDNKILIEEGINARELECAVLGEDDVYASSVGEILSAEDFYSFTSKYANSDSRTVIPADLTKEIQEEIKKQAKKAFQAVDGRGLSRVDFFLEKETNKIYINEINTMPGFTQISMYPKLMESDGIGYSDLLDKLIEIEK